MEEIALAACQVLSLPVLRPRLAGEPALDERDRAAGLLELAPVDEMGEITRLGDRQRRAGGRKAFDLDVIGAIDEIVLGVADGDPDRLVVDGIGPGEAMGAGALASTCCVLRLVLTAKPSATLADALASLLASWWAVAGSAEASGLLAISVFAFALGIYEGAQRLADPLWGYSALHRRVEEATEDHKALEDTYREDTEQVGREACAEIDAVEAAGVMEHKRAADAVEQLVRAHDYANLISRTTRLNCDTVLRLCDGELKDMGWQGQPAPLALPAPMVPAAADHDVLGPAEDKPSRILGGILRQEREFRTTADQARAEIAEGVTSHLLDLAVLQRRIADYVRKYLDTPILMRGPFDPAREVL